MRHSDGLQGTQTFDAKLSACCPADPGDTSHWDGHFQGRTGREGLSGDRGDVKEAFNG